MLYCICMLKITDLFTFAQSQMFDSLKSIQNFPILVCFPTHGLGSLVPRFSQQATSFLYKTNKQVNFWTSGCFVSTWHCNRHLPVSLWIYSGCCKPTHTHTHTPPGQLREPHAASLSPPEDRWRICCVFGGGGWRRWRVSIGLHLICSVKVISVIHNN